MKTLALLLLVLTNMTFANDVIKNNHYFLFNKSQELNQESEAAKLIDLILVVDKKSKWTQDNINSHILKTQRTLKLCDVQIRRIEFIEVDLPEHTITQLQVRNPYEGPAELKIAKAGVPKNIITGFLLRTINSRSVAYAMNLSSVIRSERYPTMPSFRALLNTFWITDSHVVNSSTPNADKTYSTLAHELIHIVGDLGHIENNTSPNLMGSSDNVGKSFFINSKQCEQVNLSSLLY